MVFNSLVFLAFFAVVYAAYRALPHRGQNWLLLVASYVFYGWWDWRVAGLLAMTSFFSRGNGRGISECQWKGNGNYLIQVGRTGSFKVKK